MYKSHAANRKICLIFREVCTLVTSCSLSYDQIENPQVWGVLEPNRDFHFRIWLNTASHCLSAFSAEQKGWKHSVSLPNSLFFAV